MQFHKVRSNTKSLCPIFTFGIPLSNAGRLAGPGPDGCKGRHSRQRLRLADAISFLRKSSRSRRDCWPPLYVPLVWKPKLLPWISSHADFEHRKLHRSSAPSLKTTTVWGCKLEPPLFSPGLCAYTTDIKYPRLMLSLERVRSGGIALGGRRETKPRVSQLLQPHRRGAQQASPSAPIPGRKKLHIPTSECCLLPTATYNQTRDVTKGRYNMPHYLYHLCCVLVVENGPQYRPHDMAVGGWATIPHLHCARGNVYPDTRNDTP